MSIPGVAGLLDKVYYSLKLRHQNFPINCVGVLVYHHLNTYTHHLVLCLQALYIAIRVETGLGHLGHDLSRSSRFHPLYKICRSDQDSALDHMS